MTSYFPDINVWIALSLDSHSHFETASAWYASLPADAELVFCRFTQLGFLRLITTRGVAGEATLTQKQAWKAYDRWLSQGGAKLEDEPYGLDLEFRAYANQNQPAPNDFADSYLAAFAVSRSIELITFDKALHKRVVRSTLLRA